MQTNIFFFLRVNPCDKLICLHSGLRRAIASVIRFEWYADGNVFITKCIKFKYLNERRERGIGKKE